jgi:hypothetical protein
MLSINTIDDMCKLEEFILKNDESFLKEFTTIHYPELVNIWFSSKSLKINYWNTDTGQHYSDVIRMDEFDNWYNECESLVSSHMVNSLKQLSGKSLSVCKRALIQTNCDIELANILLGTNN